MKTSELIGPALDWAVAKCEGVNEEAFRLYYEPTEPADYDSNGYPEFHYSTVWAQGGPIIEREGIYCGPHGKSLYVAWMGGDHFTQYGPTILIAGLRTYVASKLGYEIEIPEELK